MKYLLTFFFIAIAIGANAQFPGMIRLNPDQNAALNHFLGNQATGALPDRGKFYTAEETADILQPFLDVSAVDSAYITGDSLVLTMTTGDSLFFVGGGGGGNWFTADQVQDANRQHDAGGYDTQIDNQGNFRIYSTDDGDEILLENNSAGIAPLNQIKMTDNQIEFNVDDGATFSSLYISPSEFVFGNGYAAYRFDNFFATIPVDHTLTMPLALNAGGQLRQTNLSALLAGYSLTGHTHSFSSLTGIPTTLAGYGLTTDFNTQGDARWSLIAHTHTFASLTSKPTTIAGYGITDFNSLGDARWSLLGHTHAFSSLTGLPTTIAGYGITDYNSLGDARWIQLTQNFGGDVSGVYSNIQIGAGAVGNTELGTGIDAAKIADGSVSNTEFQYINSLSSNAQTQITAKANDADVVHDTGNETIADIKTFTSDPIIPDEAYGSGFNGSLEPVTKNAFYDKYEANPVHDELFRYYYFCDYTTHVNADVVGRDMFSSLTGAGAGTTIGTTSARRNVIGVAQSSTGTTQTGRACVISSTNMTTFGGGAWVLEVAVDSIPILSTVTERYSYGVGFIDNNTNNVMTDGAFLLYDEGGVTTGSAASANWQCVSAKGGSRTYTTSSIAVTTGRQKLRVEVNAAGTQVQYFVNGVLAGTHLTSSGHHIPTTVHTNVFGFGWVLVKTIGFTARVVNTDYFMAQCDYTTPK